MKKILLTVGLFCLALGAFATSNALVMTQIQQANLTPQQALQKLVQGNARFVQDELNQRDHTLTLKYNAQGQHPFAFVFNCVDSRSVPDFLFDQAPGNIFVGRIAGNVVDRNVLGSMEFATQFAGAKLIVVMGHTACGAVSAACKGVKAGNLTGLLRRIQPAVQTVKAQSKDFSCTNPEIINTIAKQNVLNQMHYIMQHSAIIAKLVYQKKIMLVGAMHNLADGKVQFFDINGKDIN